MKVRLALGLVSIAVAMAMTVAVGGCSGEPAPVASTPPFADEDEAFAAAEQTYRNYVEALNESRRDATSHVRPDAYLTGQALTLDIDTQRQLDEEHLVISGTTRIIATSPITAILEQVSPKVVLTVCLDSSDTRVLDAQGLDVTPFGLPSRYGLVVTFIENSGDLLISNSESAPEGFSC